MPEAMLYVSQIAHRKRAEYGSGDSQPVDEDLLNLLEVIDQVKKEQK